MKLIPLLVVLATVVTISPVKSSNGKPSNEYFRISITDFHVLINHDTIPSKPEDQNRTQILRTKNATIIINDNRNGELPLYEANSDGGKNPMYESRDNVKSGNNQTDTSNSQQSNSISTAQDFNTTRSNRQNSAIVINVGNNGSDVKYVPLKKNFNHDGTEPIDDWSSPLVIVVNPLYNGNDTKGENPLYQGKNKIGKSNNNNTSGKENVPVKNEAQDFNTTRSNRQNSNYQAGMGTNNGNPNSKDSVPKKMEAQDFNTTRSNRQNSNYQAGMGTNNGNPNSKDSVPKKMEAQDFNTTRSNRQNSNYQASMGTNNGNPNSKDSVPKKMEAQDFNTTRSNRQNSNYQAGMGTNNGNPNSKDSLPKKMEAQDFNTTRSNRQNSNYNAGMGTNNGNPNSKDSVPKKMEAQDFNTTRSNRQNSNLIIINTRGSGANNNDSSPDRQEAQDYNSSRSNKCSGHLFVINLNSNDNHNDSIPAKQEAQDYNSTRSNKCSGHMFVINLNSNDNHNDSIPAKQEAQDYNSTRSNKCSGHLFVINLNSNGNHNDSIPAKQEAQDYNSTRSNKCNAIAMDVIESDSGVKLIFRPLREPPTETYNPWEMDDENEGTVMNALFVVTVKDQENPLFNGEGSTVNPIYNGDKVNTENSTDPGSREIIINFDTDAAGNIKSGMTIKSPLYQSKNTTHENPLYKESKTKKNGSSGNANDVKENDLVINVNKTEVHTSNDTTFTVKKGDIIELKSYSNPSVVTNPTPSHQEAQDYNSTRSNKCNCLIVHGGFSDGNGGNTGSGWNGGLDYQYAVNRIFKLEAGIQFSTLKFKYTASPALPDRYLQSMKGSIRNNNWNIVTIDAGPAIQLGSAKFSADLYGKAGISFVQIPNQYLGTQGAGGEVDKQTGVSRFSGKGTSASMQAGVRLNYAINKKLAFFLNPHFFTTLGSSINYTEKNADNAMENGGDFNYDTFAKLPFEKKSETIRTIGLNAGIRICL